MLAAAFRQPPLRERAVRHAARRCIRQRIRIREPQTSARAPGLAARLLGRLTDWRRPEPMRLAPAAWSRWSIRHHSGKPTPGHHTHRNLKEHHPKECKNGRAVVRAAQTHRRISSSSSRRRRPCCVPLQPVSHRWTAGCARHRWKLYPSTHLCTAAVACDQLSQRTHTAKHSRSPSPRADARSGSARSGSARSGSARSGSEEGATNGGTRPNAAPVDHVAPRTALAQSGIRQWAASRHSAGEPKRGVHSYGAR